MDVNIDSIVKEINDIFEKDQLLDEFDWIVTADSHLIIHTNHKLGIDVKLLKSIFLFVYERLQLPKLQATTDSCIHNSYHDVQLWSRALLLVTGDNYVTFNRRRELIDCKVVDPSRELQFLNVLFTKHPKSPTAWAYRRYCLEKIWHTSPPLHCQLSELEVCRKFAELYPRNYYAWMHRQWLLDHISDDSLIYEEFKFSFTWLMSHPSDHSAVIYRNHIISRLLEHDLLSYYGSDKSAFYQHIINESSNLIVNRPGSESLWYHRRFLLHIILRNSISSCTRNDCDDIVQSDTSFDIPSYISDCHKLVNIILSSDVSLCCQEKDPCIESGNAEAMPIIRVCMKSLHEELVFVTSCFQNQAIWNAKKQESYGKNYISHLIRQIKLILVQSGINEELRLYFDVLQTCMLGSSRTRL